MIYHSRRSPRTPKANLNFKKLLIVLAAVAVFFAGWKFFTRIDRTDAIAVATAFTKALDANDTSKASNFFVPAEAATFQQNTDDLIASMKSGAKERFFERIPDAPAFTPPVTLAGKTAIVSGDKTFTLEMTQLDGKWYVSKLP